jgi:hypothetical protein
VAGHRAKLKMFLLALDGPTERFLFFRRAICHPHCRSPFARRFFCRWQEHANSHQVAIEFSLSLRTVQRLFARFDQDGEKGIVPDYGLCGLQQSQRTAPGLVEQLCQVRRDHPLWGSEMIRLELEEVTEDLPCARTIRRHLQQAGLQPAPVGRPRSAESHVPRAEEPHQGWQMDACEELILQNQQLVSWLRVVDECSGAFLKTVVFPEARWEHVTRQSVQQALRKMFQQWGMPGRFRVDNGYPWGNSGDWPPELSLWLLGLGIDVHWIDPACPRQNGVVERSQDVGQDWFEPQTCCDAAELQQRSDTYDRRQRERYPYRQGQSRCTVYPGLVHSGRFYSIRQEEQHWDATRVYAVLARRAVKRQVDCNGSVSVYNRGRYVGKHHISKTVWVSLDPMGPTWVIADVKGCQLRTHAAEELSAERIRSLTVTHRKSRDRK